MSKATKSPSPITILIEELKSEDSKRRMNSIQNLSVIATAIGPERTRSELIPYLNGSFYIDVLDFQSYWMTKMKY